MTNTEKLKEYLIGSNDKAGYLLDDNLSNGKVIMLSGAWGSGKTHFWQNEITTRLKEEQKKKEKAYAYVSLYGKTNIESIETDLFINAYNSVTGGADIVSKMCSASLSYGKKISSIISTGVTAITAGIAKADIGKMAQEVENIINEDKFTKAGKFLKDGGIVCFDDFERKSKKVDLNDLFGFITQLTLNFNCKVVIILNSDVFEGKEKEIFTTVKEKSVSKYLMFNPTCDELFEIIFEDEKYINLKSNKEILKNTFCEVGIVNARILIQILDNVLEWIKKNKDFNGDLYIRYLVLVNINFILNHHIYEANKKEHYIHSIIKSKLKFNFNSINKYISPKKLIYDDKIIESLINDINLQEILTKEKNIDINFISQNKSLVQSLYFSYFFELEYYHFHENNMKDDIDTTMNVFNKINNFIETGILI